jgi:transcriptional regulator with XRE-family HTH domain
MPRPKPKNGAVDPRWKTVGKRIAQDRKAAGLGQAELGRMIGLQTATSMWRYEDGQVTIPIARLEQIAEILGKPAARYIPEGTKPARPILTLEQQKEMTARLGEAAMQALVRGTPEAIEAFNELVAEHYARTGR